MAIPNYKRIYIYHLFKSTYTLYIFFFFLFFFQSNGVTASGTFVATHYSTRYLIFQTTHYSTRYLFFQTTRYSTRVANLTTLPNTDADLKIAFPARKYTTSQNFSEICRSRPNAVLFDVPYTRLYTPRVYAEFPAST